MLNENNLQAAFQFNASDGSFVVEPIIGEITLSENDVRVVRQSGSDKMCVDLSYSIDAAPSDLIFKINNQICLIKVVAQRTDLVNINLTNNEVAIITNDPNFRTLVWTSTSNIGKNMYYEIKTINSGISNWQLNEIATKLNALNPGEIESKLTDLEGKVIIAEGLINTLDADLTVVEENLSEANAKIGLIETAIEVLPTLAADVSELKNKTSDLESKTADIESAGGTTFITKPLKAMSDFEVAGNSLLQDLEVKGNVSVSPTTTIAGTLKDAEGFKYLKIRTGSIANVGISYSNMRVELRDGGVLTITGIYSETASQNVGGGGSYTKLNQSTPSNIIFLNLDFIIFNAVSNPLNFLAFGNPAVAANTSKYNVVYRNLANGAENINGWEGRFIITGKVDPTTLNGVVIWDV